MCVVVFYSRLWLDSACVLHSFSMPLCRAVFGRKVGRRSCEHPFFQGSYSASDLGLPSSFMLSLAPDGMKGSSTCMCWLSLQSSSFAFWSATYIQKRLCWASRPQCQLGMDGNGFPSTAQSQIKFFSFSTASCPAIHLVAVHWDFCWCLWHLMTWAAHAVLATLLSSKPPVPASSTSKIVLGVLGWHNPGFALNPESLVSLFSFLKGFT